MTITSCALFASLMPPFAKFGDISGSERHKCPNLSDLNMLHPINFSPKVRVSGQFLTKVSSILTSPNRASLMNWYT